MSCASLRPGAAVGRAPWWKVVDWRLVAAVGLPVWAFVFGLAVARKAAPAAPPSGEPSLVATAAPLPAPEPETIPPPRAIVVRHAEPEVVTVPVVVPVITESPIAALPPAAELPATELMLPADRCRTFDTKVRFHPGPVEAAAEAAKARKMLFVLHVSGNFEDPGFT
jgi:hypothetical protein